MLVNIIWRQPVIDNSLPVAGFSLRMGVAHVRGRYPSQSATTYATSCPATINVKTQNRSASAKVIHRIQNRGRRVKAGREAFQKSIS